MFHNSWWSNWFYIPRRSIRFWFQRLTRGFDDSETWSLDWSLAQLILPRLRRFRELNNGYPYGESEKTWNNKLDKMIAAFEYFANGKQWEVSKDTMGELYKHKQSLKLFAKYYDHLWW